MAETGVSEPLESARVPRNDLSQPVHSSARSAETGTDSALALQAADPPLAPLQCARTLARPDCRCHLHPGTAGRSRRPCRSRPLGGRSVARGAQHTRSHTGGASFALERKRRVRKGEKGITLRMPMPFRKAVRTDDTQDETKEPNTRCAFR